MSSSTRGESATERAWWGKFKLEEGEAGYWRIGPLELRIGRAVHDWTFEFVRGDDPLDESFAADVPTRRADLPGQPFRKRFGLTKTDAELELRPEAGDRPLIVNPEQPFVLPGREEITLYISVPVWVTVSVGKPRRVLDSLASHRLSDTWFGPTTISGELCYASRTRARVNRDNLPLPHHRAVTTVRVQNHSQDALPVTNLKVPMPFLALYATKDHRLWTNEIRLVREEDHEMAVLHTGKGPPDIGSEMSLVGEPRAKPEKNLLIRAFGGLIRP